MALVTDLASLKAAVLDYYNRSDLTTTTGGQVEVFIQMAEQRFQRDERVREPGSNNAVLTSLNSGTNWLITAEPDIYLYGVLCEVAVFLKDDDRLPLFEGRLEDAIVRLSGSVRLNPNRTALAATTYAELQLAVADALNRGDIKNVIPYCIQMAESNLRNDQRVRNLTSATYSITADDLAVPSGFRQLDSWYHDGTAVWQAIEIVDANQLPTKKLHYGATGIPRFAAILGNGATFRFAPAPDTTYSTKMVYWQTITALSAGVNWLYSNHPHIYLYATLAQCGPWVRGDEKATQTVVEAASQLGPACEALHLETWNKQWGGMVRQHFDPIGG